MNRRNNILDLCPFEANLEDRRAIWCAALEHRRGRPPLGFVAEAARRAGVVAERGCDATGDGLLEMVDVVSLPPIPTVDEVAELPCVDRNPVIKMSKRSKLAGCRRVGRAAEAAE